MTTARLDDHGLPIHGLPTMACRPRAFKISLDKIGFENTLDWQNWGQKYDKIQKNIRMRRRWAKWDFRIKKFSLDKSPLDDYGSPWWSRSADPRLTAQGLPTKGLSIFLKIKLNLKLLKFEKIQANNRMKFKKIFEWKDDGQNEILELKSFP